LQDQATQKAKLTTEDTGAAEPQSTTRIHHGVTEKTFWEEEQNQAQHQPQDGEKPESTDRKNAHQPAERFTGC
jgi:hypothetical protein